MSQKLQIHISHCCGRYSINVWATFTFGAILTVFKFPFLSQDLGMSCASRTFKIKSLCNRGEPRTLTFLKCGCTEYFLLEGDLCNNCWLGQGLILQDVVVNFPAGRVFFIYGGVLKMILIPGGLLEEISKFSVIKSWFDLDWSDCFLNFWLYPIDANLQEI